jgi:outer membrane protein, heavy metal efflux system
MLAVLVSIAISAAPPLRLTELLKEAREKNPDVRSAQLRAQAADAAVSPSGAWDDPTLMVQLWNAPVDFSTVPVMLQLSQSIPLGGKRGIRRDTAAAESRAARANAAAQSRDVQASVAKAYFDLYLAERTAQVDEEIEKTLQTLLNAALARIRTGTTQQVEALKIQGAIIQTQSAREIARQQGVSARARLAALLSRAPKELLGPTTVPGVLPSLPGPEELEQRALRERPELRAASATIESANGRIALAKAEKVPDLSVFAAEMHTFGTQGISDFIFAGVQINLPIFSGSKNDPRIAAARAQEEAEREAERGLKSKIASEVAEAYAQVRTEEKVVALHHQLIPITRQALESASAGYGVGRTDFLIVIDTLRELQSHELELAMHLAAYEQRLADLEHAVGTDLGLVEASEAGHADQHL